MALEDEFYDESFRDHIATVDDKGKRVWIFPKKPKGRYYNWRSWVSWGLLAFLFAGPYLRINGQPLLMLNVLERRFVILGVTFWPQDFWMFGLAMLTGLVFIILFTVVYGRLFCGWVCPQTIFMEMVFRKIEYLIEGDAGQQRILAKQPWNREKILKKGSKQIIFFLIAVLIANTFMAYLIGSDKMIDIVTHSPASNWIGFFAMVGFSFAFYFVFAYMREQVCTTICPYGRMQGVMLDRDSVVVAYDFVRGEPRGKLKKSKEPAPDEKPLGDCIDCHLCVHVCPTGIDIRNGTQLECVNCTACIDACDEVMDKVDRPRGLIRYASYNSIAQGVAFRFTPRIIAYTVVLVALLGVLGFAIGTRSDIQTTILRTPGIMYTHPQPGITSNLYNIQLVNKTNKDYPIEIRVDEPNDGKVRVIGSLPEAKGGQMVKGEFFLDLPDADVTSYEVKVKIGIYSNGKRIDEVKTNFMGPFK